MFIFYMYIYFLFIVCLVNFYWYTKITTLHPSLHLQNAQNGHANTFIIFSHFIRKNYEISCSNYHKLSKGI